MSFAENLWLRGQAAQQSMIHLASYNTAFMGTATLQAMHMGLHAPKSFWTALGRATAEPARLEAPNPAPKPKLKEVPAKPKAAAPAKAKPAAAPAKPKSAAPAPAKAAPAPKPVAAKPAAKPAAPKAAAKPAPKAEVVPMPKAAAPAKPAAAAKPAAPAKPAKAAKPKAAPKPAAKPVDPAAPLEAPRNGKADDLTLLSGVGAKMATGLNIAGIYHFDQIAALDEAGITKLNDKQPGFKMLCARYDLVGQAKAMSAG